jgi:peptidoglycan/xylan/chitin deacetylase (PgdA/CDA1 family)
MAQKQRHVDPLFRVVTVVLSFRGHVSIEDATFALLPLVLGYAVATFLSALLLLAVRAWEPDDAISWRMMTVDMGLILAGLGTALYLLATHAPITAVLTRFLDAERQAFATDGVVGAMWVKAVPYKAFITMAVIISLQALATYAKYAMAAVCPMWSFMFGQVNMRGCPGWNQSALTFNGLPEQQALEELLVYLSEIKATATFFVSLEQAKERRAALREVVSQGHEVGALGSTPSSWLMQGMHATVVRELGGLSSVTGSAVTLYRPLDGSRDVRVANAVNSAGGRVVLWNACGWEWDCEEDMSIAQERITRQLQGEFPIVASGGDIVCISGELHAEVQKPLPESRPAYRVVEATEAAVHALQAVRGEGVALVSVSKVLSSGVDREVNLPEGL